MGTEAAIVAGIVIIAKVGTATGRGMAIMGVIGMVAVGVVEIRIIIVAMIEKGSRVARNSSMMGRIGAIATRIMELVVVRMRTRCSP